MRTALYGAWLVASGMAATTTQAGEHFAPELATLDGSRFVQVAADRRPTLLAFWSGDCPPCVAELPALERFARTHPDWQVWLVAVDPPALARAHLARHRPALPVLRAGRDAAQLMRSAGNRIGGLPFLAAVDGLGKVCARHLGTVTTLEAMPAQCAG